MLIEMTVSQFAVHYIVDVQTLRFPLVGCLECRAQISRALQTPRLEPCDQSLILSRLFKKALEISASGVTTPAPSTLSDTF